MAILRKTGTIVEKKGKVADFTLDAPGARTVMLGGDFNNWDYNSTPLKKDPKDRTWKKSLFLKPGRYEYKFIVDGNWTIDPANNNRVVNTFGSENSIIEI